MKVPLRDKRILIGIAVFLSSISGLIAVRAVIGSHENFPDDSVHAVVVQKDGKSVIAGRFSAGHIMRLNSDGSSDSDFMSTWTSGGFNGSVDALAIQSDQKILAGGEFTRFDLSLAGHIARLNPSGSFDESFAKNTGVGLDDAVTTVRIQSNGKIWIGGKFSTFNGIRTPYLTRLNSDGSMDETFVPVESLDGMVLSITLEEDQNKLVLGGDFSEKVKVIELSSTSSNSVSED